MIHRLMVCTYSKLQSGGEFVMNIQRVKGLALGVSIIATAVLMLCSLVRLIKYGDVIQGLIYFVFATGTSCGGLGVFADEENFVIIGTGVAVLANGMLFLCRDGQVDIGKYTMLIGVITILVGWFKSKISKG